MTQDELHDELVAMMGRNRWSCSEVAEIVGCTADTVRRWRSSRPPPQDVITRLRQTETSIDYWRNRAFGAVVANKRLTLALVRERRTAEKRT